MKSELLTSALATIIPAIREELQRLTGVHSMHLRIEVDGRVHDGELKIEYQLGMYSAEVKGGDLRAVVDEFKRRHGWRMENSPLMLGYDGSIRKGESD